MADAVRVDGREARALATMLADGARPLDREFACRVDALGRGRFSRLVGPDVVDDVVVWRYEVVTPDGAEVEVDLEAARAPHGDLTGALALARRLALPQGLRVTVSVDEGGATAEVSVRGVAGVPLTSVTARNPARAMTAATLGALALLEEIPSLRRRRG